MATDRQKVAELKRQQKLSKRELLALIAKARKSLAAKVLAEAEKATPSSGLLRRAFFDQIDSVYEALDKELTAWALELASKTAVQTHKDAILDIEKKVGGAVSSSVVAFSRDHVEEILRLIHPDNQTSLAATFTQAMADADKRALQEAAVTAFRQQQVEGLTAQATQKLLQSEWQRLAGTMASDGFVDAAGRSWANNRYLDMLVRTTTARVNRETYVATLVRDGDDLARIVNVGETCPLCTAWDGLVISLSGANHRYPSYSDAQAAGVFHPNCDCLLEYVDEAVDADVIDANRAEKNVNWDDREAVSAYNEGIRDRLA